MFLLNQPFNGQLGDLLIDKMSEPYEKFTFLSAFAKNSGVLRIKSALVNFSQKGGYIKAFIGLDAFGTSYEALLNLFQLCDELYVIHSESLSTTFHSKVYALSSSSDLWLNVGSHNLTGGGLWTNFESSITCDTKTLHADTPKNYDQFIHLLDSYEDESYECSRKITCEKDIDDLKDNGYIKSEIELQIKNSKDKKESKLKSKASTLFGTHRGIDAPKVSKEHRGSIIRTRNVHHPVQATQEITESNIIERIWLETKAMTGGSRNILDLSKLGSVLEGSPVGSRYETNTYNIMLGSVAFFDIEPESTEVVKNITINYNGVDYSPCTIKFATNNGSWRVQLKGTDPSGTVKLHLVGGTDWLVDRIIILEKINSSYYSMSVVDESTLPILRSNSYVVANNGLGKTSKLFGLLI